MKIVVNNNNNFYWTLARLGLWHWVDIPSYKKTIAPVNYNRFDKIKDILNTWLEVRP